MKEVFWMIGQPKGRSVLVMSHVDDWTAKFETIVMLETKLHNQTHTWTEADTLRHMITSALGSSQIFQQEVGLNNVDCWKSVNIRGIPKQIEKIPM